MGCSLFSFGSWLLLLLDDPLDFVLMGFCLIFWDGLSLHHHFVGTLKILLELMTVFISPIFGGVLLTGLSVILILLPQLFSLVMVVSSLPFPDGFSSHNLIEVVMELDVLDLR